MRGPCPTARAAAARRMCVTRRVAYVRARRSGSSLSFQLTAAETADLGLLTMSAGRLIRYVNARTLRYSYLLSTSRCITSMCSFYLCVTTESTFLLPNIERWLSSRFHESFLSLLPAEPTEPYRFAVQLIDFHRNTCG